MKLNEDEIQEAISYSQGGPAVSRKLVGKIMERYEELLQDKMDLIEENIALRHREMARVIDEMVDKEESTGDAM